MNEAEEEDGTQEDDDIVPLGSQSAGGVDSDVEIVRSSSYIRVDSDIEILEDGHIPQSDSDLEVIENASDYNSSVPDVDLSEAASNGYNEEGDKPEVLMVYWAEAKGKVSIIDLGVKAFR